MQLYPFGLGADFLFFIPVCHCVWAVGLNCWKSPGPFLPPVCPWFLVKRAVFWIVCAIVWHTVRKNGIDHIQLIFLTTLNEFLSLALSLSLSRVCSRSLTLSHALQSFWSDAPLQHGLRFRYKNNFFTQTAVEWFQKPYAYTENPSKRNHNQL